MNRKNPINDYGDILDSNDPTFKKFNEIIQKGWKLQGNDPYQEQDMENIMNNYIKYFKQKNDRIYDEKMKEKSKWQQFFHSIKKLFIKE